MDKRKKIIRLWFDMWLQKKDLGMVFEREQLRKFEIDNLFLFSAGRVTGLGRRLRRRLGSGRGFFPALYRGGFGSLALGHFVSRWGRGLVGGRLVSLGWAALAGPRPSRFAGPRFFFLGLAAPLGFGLFRLGSFFPGGLAL